MRRTPPARTLIAHAAGTKRRHWRVTSSPVEKLWVMKVLEAAPIRPSRCYDPFVTEGERLRFKASVAQPDFRYHYRFVAVDEAVHAADLLPPRSQAFAAVLCHADRWMIDGTSCPVSASDLRASPVTYGSKPLDGDYDFEREALTCGMYQRYLKAGAVLPWATHFGRHCPEPDFVSAVHFVEAQEIRDAARHAGMVRHRGIVLLKLALIALCLGASTWWFLRHRYD